jgi:hypothetical protein
MATIHRAVFGITLCAASVTALHASAQLITLDQGSTRSLTSTSASVTTMNGVPGFISATTLRPFVTGLIPVVGDYGGAAAPIYGPATLMPRYNPGPSVVQERIARMRQEGTSFTPNRSTTRSPALKPSAVDQKQDGFQGRLAAARESSAGHATQSIAAIRLRQQQQDESRERKVAELYNKMREAQAAGKPEVARVYQQQFERESKKLSSSASSRPATR